MKDDWVYNNEEESEMGQLHATHLSLNAISKIQRKLDIPDIKFSHCVECGDEIPIARLSIVRGCKTCISCQRILEK